MPGQWLQEEPPGLYLLWEVTAFIAFQCVPACLGHECRLEVCSFDLAVDLPPACRPKCLGWWLTVAGAPLGLMFSH